MATAAEGTCPHCGRTVGVQLNDGIAAMAGGAVEALMQRDGNAVRCTNCREYVSPDDMSIEG